MKRRGVKFCTAIEHPLGSIRTGRRCPMSGWWETEDGGSRAQIFAGTVMPQSCGEAVVWLPFAGQEPISAFIEAGPESW